MAQRLLDEAGGTAQASSRIRVGLSEWQVAIAPAAASGEITLTVTNAGSAPHDLRVEGGSGPISSPLLQSGEVAELTVRAEWGSTLSMWCTVPGHREAGMEAVLTVAPPEGTP